MRIIEVKSPTRVDLAGGTLDLWPLYAFMNEATTINVAIDVWTRVTLEEVSGSEIEWNSKDLNLIKKYSNLEMALKDSDPMTKLFQSVVRFFQPRKGFRLTTQSDSPVGGGLGGSSSLTISMMKAFSILTGREFSSSHEMVHVAHNLEAYVLNTPTGTQDYYPAVSGGLNVLKYSHSEIQQEVYEIEHSPLADYFMLVYTGKSHHSGINNFEVLKSAVSKDEKTLQALEDIKIIASKLENAVLAKDWAKLPGLFNEEFKARVRLTPAFTSPEIEKLAKITLEAGAEAVKICGAGGGGCILVWCPPDKKERVAQACQSQTFQVMKARPIDPQQSPLQKSF